MTANEKKVLIAKIASRFLATQLAQIKLWEADDTDPSRLSNLCLVLAENLVEACLVRNDNEEVEWNSKD